MRRTPTEGEALLWQHLRGRKFHGRKFRRQQPIGSFVLDFYCAAERLAVEVDGPIHRGRQGRDAERDRILESLGIRLLRLADDLVRSDPAAAVARIAAVFSDNDEAQHSPSPLDGEGAGG